jgi:glycosyltransferase involved in cell wall biosynthesis
LTESHSQIKSYEETQHDPHDTPEDQRPEAALVSVVIPCYNQAHFLGEAIESVLAQSHQHFEIVVVDDGSPDNTSEAAARYPSVRLIRQENQGRSMARNTGAHHSKGSYLVFLDADDRLLPEALEAGLQCFEDHPECAFVYGHYRFIAADGSFLRQTQQRYIDKDHYPALLERNYIGMLGTVMHRRSVFETIGGFNPSINACEDWDHYLRVVRKFPIYCHDEVIAEYRMHGTNTSRDYALNLKDSVTVRYLQKKYVKGNSRYERIIKHAVENAQNYHGGKLVYEIRDHVCRLRWKQAVQEMLVLLKYYPKGLTLLLSKRRLLAQELQLTNEQLKNRDEQLEANEQQLQNRTRQLKASEQRLQNRTEQLQRLEEQNQSLTQRLQNLEQQIQDIQNSNTWKQLERISRLRARVLGR